jgi:membrane protein implicated in regulation of membrane protease activity
MRGAVPAAGTAVAAAFCCLAIPLTVGIVGVPGLAAFGTNLGVVAILATALVVIWTVRTHSRQEAHPSGDRDE